MRRFRKFAESVALHNIFLVLGINSGKTLKDSLQHLDIASFYRRFNCFGGYDVSNFGVVQEKPDNLGFCRLPHHVRGCPNYTVLVEWALHLKIEVDERIDFLVEHRVHDRSKAVSIGHLERDAKL